MTTQRLLVALALSVLGCTPDDGGNDEGANDTVGSGTAASSSGGESCMPGQIDACLCEDGSPSTQICLSDGSGYSACDCVSATGDGSDGASTSNGDSGSSSSASTGDGPAESSSGGGSSEGPPPECDGAHPLVDGDLRYCEPGNCYCGDFSVDPPFDVCYATEIAEPCCPVEVVCY